MDKALVAERSMDGPSGDAANDSRSSYGRTRRRDVSTPVKNARAEPPARTASPKPSTSIKTEIDDVDVPEDYKEYARRVKRRLSKVEEMMPSNLTEELFLAWRMVIDLTKSLKVMCTPFMDKVDTQALGLWDYKLKVKRPMWFNKILEKFNNNEYGTILDVLDDFYLMLENCLRYNGPDHYISKRALKLDTSMAQKISLLPRSVKEKVMHTMSEDSGHLQCYDMQKVAQSMREAVAVKRRHAKKQELKERRQKRQLEEEELNVWYKELIGHEEEWKEFRAMHELPQIGHMVYLCQEALHFPEINCHQTLLERGLYMPRESGPINKLMTVLLQSPSERVKFFKSRRGSFTYHQWNIRLRNKLSKWYQKFRTVNRNAEAAAMSLSIEPKFFSVLGRTNPLVRQRFHELTPYRRVWIVKSLIDQIVDTQESLKQAIESNPGADQTEYRLGMDALGYTYIHFPQFCGNDVRVYRCAPEATELPILRPCTSDRSMRKRRHHHELRADSDVESTAESDTESSPRKKGRSSRSPSPSASEAESTVSNTEKKRRRKRRLSSDLSDTDTNMSSTTDLGPTSAPDDPAPSRSRDMRRKVLSRLLPFSQYEETSCDSNQSFGSIDMSKVKEESSDSDEELPESVSAFASYKDSQEASQEATEPSEVKPVTPVKLEPAETRPAVKSESPEKQEPETIKLLPSGKMVFYPSPVCPDHDEHYADEEIYDPCVEPPDAELGYYSDEYDAEAYSEVPETGDHGYAYRAAPLLEEEDEVVEEEEEPEILGPELGEFELVAMDLPELCSLVERLETEGARPASPVKKIRPWMTLSERRKAETELVDRLRFLRDELEPYRWKFNHAQNKMRDRIRRDFDDYIEPPDPIAAMYFYIKKLTNPGEIDDDDFEPSDWMEAMVPEPELLRAYETVRLVNERRAHTSILDDLNLPEEQTLIKTEGGFSIHPRSVVQDSNFQERFNPTVVKKHAMRVRYGMTVPELPTPKPGRKLPSWSANALANARDLWRKKKEKAQGTWAYKMMLKDRQAVELSQSIYGYIDVYYQNVPLPPKGGWIAPKNSLSDLKKKQARMRMGRALLAKSVLGLANVAATAGVTSPVKADVVGIPAQYSPADVKASGDAPLETKPAKRTAIVHTQPTIQPGRVPVHAVQPIRRDTTVSTTVDSPASTVQSTSGQPLNMVEIMVQAVPHVISTAFGNLEGYLTTQGVFIPKDGAISGRRSGTGASAIAAPQSSADGRGLVQLAQVSAPSTVARTSALTVVRPTAPTPNLSLLAEASASRTSVKQESDFTQVKLEPVTDSPDCEPIRTEIKSEPEEVQSRPVVIQPRPAQPTLPSILRTATPVQRTQPGPIAVHSGLPPGTRVLRIGDNIYRIAETKPTTFAVRQNEPGLISIVQKHQTPVTAVQSTSSTAHVAVPRSEHS